MAKVKSEDHPPTLTVFIIDLGLNFGIRCLRERISKERTFRDVVNRRLRGVDVRPRGVDAELLAAWTDRIRE